MTSDAEKGLVERRVEVNGSAESTDVGEADGSSK